MVAIGRTSHAIFFDGVSDSILIPQGRFTKVGQETPDGTKTGLGILNKTGHGTDDKTKVSKKGDTGLSIEAWVVPDCGGVVAHREGQFTLEFGTVDSPGPVKFSAFFDTPNGIKKRVLSSASDAASRWDGIIFPEQEHGGIHDSYNRYDTSNYGDATNLNFNHRPLYHIVAGVTQENMFVFVNGKVIVSESIDKSSRLAKNSNHIYLGGKGGEFRGAMEAIHISRQFDNNMISSSVPLLTGNSTALYRFEEPLDIVSETYQLTALGSDSSTPYSVASDGSTTTITISTTDAQNLATKLTGTTQTSGTVTFTSSPYSMGNYKVIDYYTSPGSKSTLAIPHTPYNLLINPGAINRNTHKPNQSPPERVRLESINVSTGVLTVSSIHLDFVNGTNGKRGLLHSRTADVDDYFVVVASDLLIDNGTGRPYQPPHYNSQVIDRTGQMVIDESTLEQHGLMYSSQMATTTTHPNNPFAVVWPSSIDELFQIGHSGRHAYSHIDGHEYMRKFPNPMSLVVDQQIGGAADIVSLSYDNTAPNVDRFFTPNALADFYNTPSQISISAAVNSSPASFVVGNGLPESKEQIIAIGGTDFDFKPFMLKGPVPELDDINDDTRNYHLRPETESRIALLKVPTLGSTHNLAPYVEIHYNAIDLTGASMSKTTPVLLVEKTVPSGNFVLTGSTTVMDVIEADLADASKDTTLFAPGGFIEFSRSATNLSPEIGKSHNLVGDNTGGADIDNSLDFSRCPVNYTPPNDANAEPASPPTAVNASHNDGVHKSVYHKLTIDAASIDNVTFLSQSSNLQFIKSPEVENTGTGVFDKGGTNEGTPVHEMFDIIDNIYYEHGVTAGRIYIQPSNKSRTNQLAKVRDGITKGQIPNVASIMYLMSRTRIRSIRQDKGADGQLTTHVTAAGINEELINENVNITGSGSPDSHVVKEIEPNSPVVTVTLGGPGQGAVNTKPTYDPSALMRLPGSTRRNCAVKAHWVDTTSNGLTMSVTPLNNYQEDITSWGTYCFPKVGRIYLVDGSSAAYISKNATGFTFSDTDAIASGTFLLANGTPVSSFHKWCNATNLISETSADSFKVTANIYNDNDFENENLCDDGSTVNDRLFQSMDTVNHDYQLGTQFASTRAMTEIPIFPQQFFEQTSEGIFPGPDNSMKLHLDATYTAHTWNPSPVGKRVDDIVPNDREAKSAHTYIDTQGNLIRSATITQIVKDESSASAPDFEGTLYKIYVSHPKIFQTAQLSKKTYRNHLSYSYLPSVYLSNNEFAYYSNDPQTDGFVTVAANTLEKTKNGAKILISDNFIAGLQVGAKLFTSSVSDASKLIPLSSDSYTDTSDYEGRRNFYHDAANMLTQGGNLDYGLRQYVSAVEFKAGPLDNPHAPRISPKRARSKILGVSGVVGTLAVLHLEDGSQFPDPQYTVDSSGNAAADTGDMIYVCEILKDTPVEVLLLGNNYSSALNLEVTENSLLVFGSTLTDVIGHDIRLKKVGRSHLQLSDPANANGYEETVSTFRPTTSGQIWTFSNNYSTSVSEIRIQPATSTLYAHANTVGINLRPNDTIYLEEPDGDIKYVGQVDYILSPALGGVSETKVFLKANVANTIDSGDKVRVGIASMISEDPEALLNRTWNNPYASGGLRNGDTIWMNMTVNNPHATEGLFCKSRGVMNEAQVYSDFNGGEGVLTNRPRDSIPMENFLIGETCLETATNFVQHVNRTIELNYLSMGLDASQAPTVAYVDPYLATAGHARVLLFDVAHDREFIAFHDLHMQVQSSASTPIIGHTRKLATQDGGYDLDVVLAKINGGAPHYLTTQLDVANGFPSENKFLRNTQQSKFIESAYAHNLANMTSKDLLNITDTLNSVSNYLMENPLKSFGSINEHLMGKGHGHVVHGGVNHESTTNTFSTGDSVLPRVQPAVASLYYASHAHNVSRRLFGNSKVIPFVQALKSHRYNQDPNTYSFRDASTLFDTPDGTRVISAFLCLKGIRNQTLSLAEHEESRLQYLNHWTEMDFVRRLTVDFGEVGVKEGVTDIEAAAKEIVRLINQSAAKNGRTHARRPSHQYPGEAEILDLTRIGVREDTNNPNKDPAGTHINADFAATGSTYDPAPWWSPDEAFNTHDRGSHMGYLRAHLGRVVEDKNGVEGFSIVIHSTIPGASARNFCVWLDNSKGQSTYNPQFLIGHGGRFRNFWCQPDEDMGENMHPAPMPINKHGRPFAPVTTLREMVRGEFNGELISSNHDYGVRTSHTTNPELRNISGYLGSGMSSNTINDESFESQGPSSSLVEGLRVASNAIGRINFGGMVVSGIPGWSPIAGKWGLGEAGDTSFDKRYSESIITGGTSPTSITSYSSYIDSNDVMAENVGDSHLYGLKLTDHRGNSYGVRYVYRELGLPYSNDNTIIPNTIENEIGIFFDDKDVSQGGFTIGQHMIGYGDVTGRIDTSGDLTEDTFRGNYWSPFPSPSVGIDSVVTWNSTTETLTVVLQAPFHTGGSEISNHPDILGYLGFPATNGLLQINDTFTGTTVKGIVGHTLSYESRTQNDKSGTHIFHGVKGASFTSSHFVNSGTVTNTSKTHPSATGSTTDIRVLISPRINWTCLITDELMSAVTNAAINLQNPNVVEGVSFDCTNMKTADGRTFGEWGVSPDAIKIRAFNPEKNIRPISDMFESSIHPDLGIEAAHIEYGLYQTLKRNATTLSWEVTTGSESANEPYSDADIDDNKTFNSGYIPLTVLQIKSKGRGYHANTATPVIVDSTNKPINLDSWTENLKGANFTRNSGDHILPCLDESNLIIGDYYHDGIFTLSGSITAAGTGYSASTIYETTSSGSGTGAKIKVNSVGGTGNVTGVDINFAGTGYAASEVLTLTGGGGNAQVTVASILTRTLVASNNSLLYQTLIPAGQEGSTVDSLAKKASFGEKVRYYAGNSKLALLQSANGANSATHLTFDFGETNKEWTDFFSETVASGSGVVLNKFPFDIINGIRFYGSVDSEPVVYFKGAKDSPDHSVPLYFGGGFSGVVLDVNDGTQNDYSSFYTHPYSSGPTGTSGIQHANEISTSFAHIDCNALLAFFPGTALLNQHRGSISSPVSNKNNVLSTDIFAGTLLTDTNVPSSIQAKYSAGVVRQKPTPMVLRFAHPTARYEDYKNNVESKTTYLIFGPGQAFPLAEKNTTASGVFPSNNPEPHPGKVVTVGNSWSKVPAEMRLPNELFNDAGYFGPPTSTYQNDRHKFHYNSTLNWSPPHGIPNYGKLRQRPEHGYHYGEHFNNPVSGKITLFNKADFFKAHPYKHCSTIYYGIAMAADMTYHMDGGYHPGGHWLDNQLAFNPPNPNSNYRITSWSSNVVNPAAFRVSGPMGAIYDPTSGSGTAANFNTDYILVDATRCQNGEELAAVLGQAINEYPGTGALKAMGGTFLPSMGNSMRQDRYGWVEMAVADFTSDYGIDESGTFADMVPFQNGESMGDGTHSLASSKTYVIAKFSGGGRELHEQIPPCGWLRTPDGGRDNGPALTEASCDTNHTSGLSDGSSTSVRHITHTANSNIVVGLYVKGTGIPDGTVITAINNSTCFTISKDPTATNTNVTLTFTNLNVPMFAPYHSREVYNDSGTYKVKFYLAPNRISGFPLFEDAKTFYDICEGNSPTFPMPGQTITGTGIAMATPTRLFVWSKAGVHRFNNESESTRDHMTQVHFNGLVDAIDRTRPVGAVGWAGERYSYLNSLKVSTSSFTDATCDTDTTAGSGTTFGGNPRIIRVDSTANLTRGMFVSGTGIPANSFIEQIDSTTLFRINADVTATNTNTTLTFTSNLYGAGLGAWYPKLGFSPYGSNNSCMNALGHIPTVYPNVNSPEGNPRVNLVNGTDETITTPYTWNVGLASTDKFYKSFTVGSASYNNQTTITHASSSSIVRGMGVSGSGIPTGAYVASVTDATHFELSVATTGGSKSSQTLTFTPLFEFETSESVSSRYSFKPIHANSEFILPDELTHPQGVYSRAFLVVSYESELPLVAKYDRDGIKATGDWLAVVSKTKEGVAAATAITFAGTSRWDERFHHAERYIAPANAGPNVEALIYANTQIPTIEADLSANGIYDSTTITAALEGANLLNAEPCHAKTGDLFFDLDNSPGSIHLESNSNVERNILTAFTSGSTSSDLDVYADDANFWLGDTNAYKLSEKSPIDNFSIEHIVWKRMDGGNLSLPAVNARGLGAIPFVTRVVSTNSHTTGEKIYGVNRFSFETTNSAMFPIIQAQELSHPQLAASHPDELRNVLEIPNEEIQFEGISVMDDTGQVHTVEGGSPFGTIIRTFNQISDRVSEGLAPAISGSGIEPNLQIRLPDPNAVPGNIVIRSGFDRLQSYQTETLGTGGMMRPKINAKSIGELFNIRYPNDDDTFATTKAPRLAPFYSDHLWEHISQSATGEAFPDSTFNGWESATNNAPIETSYELHDRSLYFHVTKNGNTHTHKHPTYYTHSAGVTNNDLTGVSFSGTTLTVNATIDANIFSTAFGDQERDTGTRRFLRLYNPTTDRGGVASFTGISGATFTGCVGDAEFTSLVASSITSLKVVPSYYMPAGSTRFFASRRLRDHAEVSGNSPDMVNARLVGNDAAASKVLTGLGTYQATELTPAPIPRMGHHFVNPTMAMLPGHWAHPAYQGLYKRHKACRGATKTFFEKEVLGVRGASTGTSEFVGRNTTRSGIDTALTNQLSSYDPMLYFSTINATPSGPSDVHGGGFTLMFESKVRYDGYGVLASKGQAGVVNSKGGHTIVLEAAGTYSLTQHFPDPAEVGSYQIIIQPNILPNQFIGFHENGPATDVPDGSVEELTTQQTALVIGIREIDHSTGALGLVLANATMADVRGCEVFINEIMVDQDPDFGSQFTNIPPLLLYNPLGVQSSESPAFIKESLPYHPNMFLDSTPGYTINTPWWSMSHKVGPDDSSSYGYRHLSWHRMDNYYYFLRANAGSIAAQLTLAGYPSTYPDIYSEINELISVTPVCSVVSVASTSITVDDARGFPKQPYYGEVLEYTDANGIRRTHTYTERSGYDATNMNKPKLFTITANTTFTDNLTAGTKIRLSRMNDFRPAGAILKESKTSIMTRNLPQNLQGTRDTNSLHMADAFLCLWHPNLGRPHTYYSDSTRTWLSSSADKAIDQKPLNSMPEHFETIHYHDATYFTSPGPFGFKIKTPKPSTVNNFTIGGAAYNNDPTITHNSTKMLVAGMTVSGTGIPVGATISSVTSDTEFELSVSTTGGSKTGQTLTFGDITVTFSSISGARITHSSNGNIIVGSKVTGTNIPTNATVANVVSATQFDLSVTPGSTPSGTLTITGQPRRFVSRAANAITTSPGLKFAGGTKISLADRTFTVSSSTADTGTVITVIEDTPTEFNTRRFRGEFVQYGADGDGGTVTEIEALNTYDILTVGSASYNNDPTIDLASTASLEVGMRVDGDGIPSGATIASITDADTFELSVSTTGGAKSSETLTFYKAVAYQAQAGTSTMLNHFWPCGSRGGPITSRLDGYGYVSSSWVYPRDYGYDKPIWTDADDDGSYTVSSGISKSNYSSLSNTLRTRPFGYRFGLRQPYNKPQWATYGLRALRESAITATNASVAYQHGPLVQVEGGTWTYAGGEAGVSNPTLSDMYVGILERQTNFSGMLNVDKPGYQVRYSDGMRFTRPFGCPVRTLRNASSVARDWWGDSFGKNLSTIEDMVGYYIVDWWGNTRGEDVRRFPVRGFGIRPAWDAGDSYEFDRSANETPATRSAGLFNLKTAYNSDDGYATIKSFTVGGGSYNNDPTITHTSSSSIVAGMGVAGSGIPSGAYVASVTSATEFELSVSTTGGSKSSQTLTFTDGRSLPRFGGRLNIHNNASASTLIDVFFPRHSLRVGDMGNGRGVRYPTMFNEDVLTALNEPNHTTGMVLSHHTAEPNLNDGYLRARNDILQNDEVPRGISARLEIDEDGLLKPEAVVSDRVENISGSTPHKDAISRSSPRIGIDTENVEGEDVNLIVLNTEAHSLHTDRNVGQRVVLQGGMTTGSQTLADYDLTALTFAAQPAGGVMRMSHTSNFNPLGGVYIAETKNYLSPIDDTDWGSFSDATCDTNHTSGLSDGSSTSVRHITMDSTAKLVVGMTVTGTGIPSSATVAAINNATCFTLSADTTATNANTTLTFGPPVGKGSNPYVTDVFTSASKRANTKDKSISFMLKPVRLLDKQHIEMFRSNLNLATTSPQYGSNYFAATAGGKYGLFTYETTNGRATSGGQFMTSSSPNTNAPYTPAYFMDISADESKPISKGPKLKGTGVTGYDTTTINNEVTRVVMSQNTLEHYRSDASRRRTFQDDTGVSFLRKDFSVQPRFSQSLHPKGHKGDLNLDGGDLP